jgi:predicted amidohydrolase YtcJ
MLADVIVLSEDMHQIPERQLLGTTVTYSIAGGQIIHSQTRPRRRDATYADRTL